MSNVFDYDQIQSEGLLKSFQEKEIKRQKEKGNFGKNNIIENIKQKSIELFSQDKKFKDVVEQLKVEYPDIPEKKIIYGCSNGYGALHNFFPKLGKNKESNTIKMFLLPSNDYLSMLDKKGNPIYKPYIRKWTHRFYEGNKKFTCTCRKTFTLYDDGEKDYYPCPACKKNVWDKDDKAVQDEWYRKRAKENGWINAYIVDDLLYPENNGQVKRVYMNGILIKKVNDRILGKFDKQGKQVVPGDISVLEPTNGAYFQIMVEDGKFTDYDNSCFVQGAPLFGGDKEQIKNIIKDIRYLEDTLSGLSTEEEIEERYDKFFSEVCGLVGDKEEVVPKQPDTVKQEEGVPVKNKQDFNDELKLKFKQQQDEDDINDEELPTHNNDVTEVDDFDVDALINSVMKE